MNNQIVMFFLSQNKIINFKDFTDISKGNIKDLLQ